MKAGLDSEVFCDMSSAAERPQGGRDPEADRGDIGAPVWKVRGEKQGSAAVVRPLKAEDCLSLQGSDNSPAGVRVYGPGVGSGRGRE